MDSNRRSSSIHFEHLSQPLFNTVYDVPAAKPAGRTDDAVEKTVVQQGWHCPSARSLKRKFRSRSLTSRPAIIILVLSFLASYAFYAITQSSVVSSVLSGVNPDAISLVQQALEYGIAMVVYPIGGILADVYVGRHRTARVCLMVLWIAMCFFTLSVTAGNSLIYVESQVAELILLSVIPIICLIINSIGSGIFQLSLLVFGGDQLFDAPTDKVSSYIYWWYWTKNLGVFLGYLLYMGIIALEPIETSLHVKFTSSLQPMLVVVILTAAIVMDIFTKQYYEAEHKNSNPIKLVFGVLRNSRQPREAPPFMSAFRYGEDPPSGLELARQYHGGHYTDEQVQDVRTFGRMIVFILSLSGFMMLYFGIRNMVKSQVTACSLVSSRSKYPSITPVTSFVFSNLEPLLNSLFVLLLTPIVNNLVFPLMGNFMPNMRKRIGCGMFLLLLAAVTSCLLELDVSSDPLTRAYWFILPIFISSAAEVAAASPILEFIYAQGPDNMKGLLIGIYYLLFGVWGLVANVIIYYLSIDDDCTNQELSFVSNTTLWYYCVSVGVGVVGLLLYTVAAYYYKIRKRNNPITDNMRITGYYNRY